MTDKQIVCPHCHTINVLPEERLGDQPRAFEADGIPGGENRLARVLDQLSHRILPAS